MTDQAARYRDVFAVREYRYLFSANVLSQIGDQLAAVALAFLIYGISKSPTLAAASFASSYLAWIVGGPVLSVFADRLPRRTVLIACDLVRAGLFLLLAVDGMPAVALVGVAFVAHLFHAPFLAARSSLTPEILDDDRYTVANGLDNLVQSVTQVLGFAVGGALLGYVSVREALLLDAATFVLSAALVAYGVLRRPAAAPAERERATATSTVTAGVRIVFGDPTLRAYVLLLWAGCAFLFAVEGLVAPLAEEYGGGAKAGGLLLAAAPAGCAVGTVLLTRLCGPARRQRLIIPLALLSCAVLVPMAFRPPLWLVIGLLVLAGLCNAYIVPLNPMFGRAVPNAYRARAFGVAMSGLCAVQGLAMLLAGALAESQVPTTVIAGSGLLGTLAVAAVAVGWPRPAKETTAATPAAPAPAHVA